MRALSLLSPEAAAEAAAAHLAQAIAVALSKVGAVSIALSGGSTPGPIYQRLSAHALPWERVTILLVDERFVPPADPQSNEALVRRTLLQGPAAAAAIKGMRGTAAALAAAADAADAAYRGAPPLAGVLLGMGEDGHTASWFAGAEGLEAALDPRSTRQVSALRAPAGSAAEPVRERLSLTLAAIARAPAAALVFSGPKKAAAFEQAAANAAPVASAVAALGARLTVFQAP
jgi:6-phosphogluconolactonase